MNPLLKFYSLRHSQLTLFIILSNLLLAWISKEFLVTETVFYNSYSEMLTLERAMQLFAEFKHYSWIGYILTPFLLYLKFLLISFVLYIGVIFIGNQYKVPLKAVLKVVIASEIIFLLGALVKIIWFCFFAGNYIMQDLGFFYPLSLANIFRPTEIQQIWSYPLQTVNLFHFIYILLLSYGLNNICEIRKSESEKIVLVSYIPALVLWITFIMFLSVDKLI
jgi:hypothetical protein